MGDAVTVGLSPSECAAVEATLKSHRDVLTYAASVTKLEFKKNSKKRVGPAILALGAHHIYLFKANAKSYKHAHWLWLSELSSPSVTDLLIWFGKKSQVSIEVADADEIIRRIVVLVRSIIPTMTNNEKFAITVEPPGRKALYLDAKPPPFGPCGGFQATYLAVCSSMQTPPLRSIVDSVKLWQARGITAFDLNEHSFARNPSDLDAVCKALGYNLYFKKLSCRMQLPEGAGEALALCLSSNRALETVTLSKTGLPPAAFVRISEALYGNTKHRIVNLDLSDNSLGEAAIAELSKFISRTDKGLVSVRLHRCGASRDIGLIGRALQSNRTHWKSLEYLDFGGNKLEGTESIASLGPALRYCESLRELHLNGVCVHKSLSWEPVFRNLEEADSLEVLDISHNNMSDMNSKDQSYRDFIAYVRTATKLVDLNLSYTNLPVDTVEELCRAAAGRLLQLDASGFYLPDSDVPSLIRGLEFCTSLEELKLDELMKTKPSKSRNHALATLQKFVAGESAAELQVLSLRGDGAKGRAIFGEDLIHLFRGLESNNKLMQLDISGHQFGAKGAAALARVIQLNSNLRILHFDSNSVPISGFRTLGVAIQRNSTLVQVAVPIFDLQKALQDDREGKFMAKWVRELQTKLMQNAQQKAPVVASVSSRTVTPMVFQHMSKVQRKSLAIALSQATKATKGSVSTSADDVYQLAVRVVGETAMEKIVSVAEGASARAAHEGLTRILERKIGSRRSHDSRERRPSLQRQSSISGSRANRKGSNAAVPELKRASSEMFSTSQVSVDFHQDPSRGATVARAPKALQRIASVDSGASISQSDASNKGSRRASIKIQRDSLAIQDEPTQLSSKQSAVDLATQASTSFTSLTGDDFDEQTMRDLDELTRAAESLSTPQQLLYAPNDLSSDDERNSSEKGYNGRTFRDFDPDLESDSDKNNDDTSVQSRPDLFLPSNSATDDSTDDSHDIASSAEYAYVPPPPNDHVPSDDESFDALPLGAALSELAAMSSSEEEF